MLNLTTLLGKNSLNVNYDSYIINVDGAYIHIYPFQTGLNLSCLEIKYTDTKKIFN